MSVSLYDISSPILVRGLNTLSALLDKAASHAEARKFDPKALLEARLFPDMYAFVKQVQVVCDVAKGTVARLADVEVPKHEDNEATIAELKARVAKTLEFVKSISRTQVDSAAGRTITMKFPNATLSFPALGYITDFGLPNFYFHLSMAYALLRHNGVEIGKRDFLGAT